MEFKFVSRTRKGNNRSTGFLCLPKNKPGEKVILLGNEAIVRGALESGVQFVSTYPGTPASEIGDIFFKIAKEAAVYFEFSTNEKVALEAGIGASFSGLKTLVAMKNFGANVALDALLPFAYTGVMGPAVIVIADDPSCHSSAQSEENSRGLAYLSHIPILEPSDPQECKDFMGLAFRISEEFKIPIIIRLTTRVAHQKAPVVLGEIQDAKSKGQKAIFFREPKRFVTLPPRVMEMKKELLEKIAKIRELSERNKINKIVNQKSKIKNWKLGIIASGVSYLYAMEALRELDISLPVLKLGFFYPLPEKKIRGFIKDLKKVLIIEELEPYLESEVERLAKKANCKLEIAGKNLLPEVGELKPEIVTAAVSRFKNPKSEIKNPKQIPNSQFQIPKRFPRFCPGCSYWLVFNALKKALTPKDVIFGGDIGCYMLFGTPSVAMQDYLLCMGSSIGIAHGIKKSFQQNSENPKQKLIAFIGDSTFFHSGISGLINTVFNKSNPLIIILDNQTTAMTGHQPHPGSPVEPNGIKIESIVQACGVKNLKIIDPINQEEFIQTVKEFLEKEEVSVIIARRICALLLKKRNEKK